MLAGSRLRRESIGLACECRARSASEEYGGCHRRFPWLGILMAIFRTSKRNNRNHERKPFYDKGPLRSSARRSFMALVPVSLTFLGWLAAQFHSSANTPPSARNGHRHGPRRKWRGKGGVTCCAPVSVTCSRRSTQPRSCDPA